MTPIPRRHSGAPSATDHLWPDGMVVTIGRLAEVRGELLREIRLRHESKEALKDDAF